MATQRWIVTYTKHMKQKRKVYQDGVLELCCSTGTPQIILYDNYEKLIDRRFLKKDDIVKSGGTLPFETHIVEIGDPSESNTPSAESSEKPGTGFEQHKEKLCIEWNVLYTTQLTQKAKKYHDGVLRLPACSSHLNPMTLLNEDGAVLSRKYIKSVACLDTGISCEFPNYLVKICEKRASAVIQGDSINVRTSCEEKDSLNQVSHSPEKCDILGSSRKACRIPLHNVFKTDASGCRASKTMTSTVSNLQKNHSTKVTTNCSSKDIKVKTSTNLPLRDVCQILSVLKKPSPEGSLVLEDPLVEQGLTSESSKKCQLEIQVFADFSVPSVPGSVLVQDADCEGSSSAFGPASSSWMSGRNGDQGPSELFSSPSGAEKDSELSSSIELGNLEQIPTFDLGF